MSATAQPTPTPTKSDSVQRWLDRRAAVNQANSQYSTGPRTPAGKQRSSRNALTHGLTAASPVQASEDLAAYQLHCRQLFDEYKPATPTESLLIQQLADTAWRLNRIPALEAALLDRAANSPASNSPDAEAAIQFDIVDAHRALATLGLHGARLARQFQKTLEELRELQSSRAERERRDLKDAAALFELHKHKGIPWQPADHGFVFSLERVERFAERLVRLNQSRHIEHVLFHMQPPLKDEAARAAGTAS